MTRSKVLLFAAMLAAGCAIGGTAWPIGIGRYTDRAEMCRVLAGWVEDEYRALRDGGTYQRQVELDDRGMFPGTLAP